ncbi:MAG: Xaa-Pro peptidase family protein [Thermoleophilia bacterium]|nr:Xaa-Pro peptidase family protein [Thermoleophilia bacterium]
MDRTYRHRLERCGRIMENAGLDALLLTKPANMFYLTGDGRLCAYAIVTRGGQVALGVPATDVADVSNRAHFDEITGFADEVGMIHAINQHLRHFGVGRGTLGLEYTFLTQSMMAMVTHPHAKPESVTVADATPILSALRMVKEPAEVERIRVAAGVATKGIEAAVSKLHVGMTESQVAAEAEYAMRQAGAENFYRTYVSSGPRTNIAHGLPTARRLEDGDLLMIDVHPVVHGYSADLCRTTCLGRPTSEQAQAFDDYLLAQQATIDAIAPGVTVADLEARMHAMLRDSGHGDSIFGPPIHGVGIEFEEAPLPPDHAFFHGEKDMPAIQAGVVLSVGNCGLYAGGWGVRVEDTNVATAEGRQTLTEYPRVLTP